MALSTADVMAVSLDLVGWEEVPADSAVYVPGEGLETALVGIDLEAAELHVAAERGYDLVLTHHPAGGAARVEFTDVLDRQVGFMTDHGVAPADAEAAVEELREDRDFAAHAANYRHDPSVAELLDQPYMNVHLAPDELGRRAFAAVADDLPPDATVGEFADALATACPELDGALTDVEVRVGDRSNPAGEIAVHHAAGTNGGASVARAYFDAGVDTVLYIHASAADARELRAEYPGKNLVVTGHVASDAVGLNRFVDALEERGLECTRLSGLRP